MRRIRQGLDHDVHDSTSGLRGGVEPASLGSSSTGSRLRVAGKSLLAGLVGLIACVDSLPGRVLSGRQAPSDRVVVESVPFLTIGGSEADTTATFGLIVGATRLSSGAIVAVDRLAAAIFFFDAKGQLLRRVGRSGDGPGEFRLPEWIQQCTRDTLFVADGRQLRLSMIDSAGKFIRQMRYRSVPWRTSCNREGVLAVLMYPEAVGVSSTKSPVYTSQFHLWYVAGDSTRVAGEVPAGQNRPMSALTSVAVGPDRVYIGPGDSGSVRVYDLSGRQLRPLSIDVTRRASTPVHYEAAIVRQVAPMRTNAERERFKAQLLAIPRPSHLPVYQAVHTDPTGNLWIVTSAPGDGFTEFVVVDPRGRPLGNPRVPLELVVYEIGRDYVLGYHEDFQAKPSLLLYRYRPVAGNR